MKLKSLFFLLILPEIIVFIALMFLDFGQCDRKCVEENGKESNFKGLRIFNRCICYKSELLTRKYDNQISYSKIDDTVCGVDKKTYKRNEIKKKRIDIMHSGSCGYCSNEIDINVMKITQNNLTDITTKCALIYLFLGGSQYGERLTKECMDKYVGFTQDCLQCWVDNMGCTISHCFFTCTKSLLMREPKNYENGDINSCLRCDENNCGPTFVTCAGANRRKSGIVSDIGRPVDELFSKKN